MRWQKKLTKKELKHLREMGITTLGQARKNAEHQKQMRDDPQRRGLSDPCWECRTINTKLGLPI